MKDILGWATFILSIAYVIILALAYILPKDIKMKLVNDFHIMALVGWILVLAYTIEEMFLR